MANLILRPNADGNYTAWDGFSLTVPHTPLYDLIDESDYVVGTGDDDYISTSTADAAFTVELSNTISGNWPRATRISSIRIVAVVRQIGASSDFTFRLRTLEQDIDSPVQTLTSTTYTEVGYTFNLGLNGYAWDVPTLDRLEAGLVFSSGDELRCTKLEVYVHHEPFPHYTLIPDGNGALQDWSPVPSGSPDYMTVSGVYDGDLSYLADSTVNNQSTFTTEDLPASLNPPNIDRVSTKALVKNVGSVMEEADSIVRSGGVIYNGGTRTTATKIYPDDQWYLLTEDYLNDPNVAWPSGNPAATAWTASEVNALEVGVENAGGGNFRCTSIATEVWLAPTYPTTIDLFPTADGYHQDWSTIVGAANAWQTVDEDPPDDATSYVELDSSTLGISAYSSFTVGGVGSVPAGERIYNVEIRCRVRLDNLPHSEALVAAVQRNTRNNETYVAKPQIIEGMAGTWFDVKWDLHNNPHTGLPWTNLAEVTTSMEYGFVVLEGAMLLSRVRAQVQTIADYRAATVDPIDAKITDAADALIVRSQTDGTIFGVTEFSIGTGGYDTTDPETVTVVNSADVALLAELYRDGVDRIEYDGDATTPTVDYWCRVPKEVAQGGIGEIGLWAEIFWSPVAGETGTKFLFATAHHPIQTRHVDDVHFYKIQLQYWDFGANLLVDGDAEFKGLQLLADGDMEAGPGPELVTDGDMEAAGTAAWVAGASAVLSKQAGSPGGSGTQVLRVAYGGTNNPNASQSILTSGITYRVTGWARGDGTGNPAVFIGGANRAWTGTSSATWQAFDVTSVASGAGSLYLRTDITGAGYSEFDDVTVVVTCPAWTPNNNPVLSKQAGDPSGVGGSQVFRVEYNGTANPQALQAVLTVGQTYRVVGWARGDGTCVPRVLDGTGSISWTGTSSATWQQFDVSGVAGSINLVLRGTIAASGYAEFDNVVVTNDTPAWLVSNSAILSKETTNPYEGLQALRVTYNSVADPIAYQNTPLSSGTIYYVDGYARGDGSSGKPRVATATGAALWTGTTSTSWQNFSFLADPAGNWFRFLNNASSGYADFDELSVRELNSYDFLTHGAELVVDGDMEAAGVAAWTAGASATLTKQTTNPYEGLQVLRVAYGGVANPYAAQSIMAPGTIYHLSGVVRSDGTGVPTVLDGTTTLWTGSTSTDWQEFNLAFDAANADVRLRCTIAVAGYCEFDAVTLKAISLP